MRQDIDSPCTTRLGELLNVLLHADVETFEKQVGHDQTQRVLLPHFKQVFRLAFEVVLILTFHLIDVLIQKLAKKFLSLITSMRFIKANGRGISNA